MISCVQSGNKNLFFITLKTVFAICFITWSLITLSSTIQVFHYCKIYSACSEFGWYKVKADLHSVQIRARFLWSLFCEMFVEYVYLNIFRQTTLNGNQPLRRSAKRKSAILAIVVYLLLLDNAFLVLDFFFIFIDHANSCVYHFHSRLKSHDKPQCNAYICLRSSRKIFRKMAPSG